MTDCIYFLLYLALGKLSLMLLINYNNLLAAQQYGFRKLHCTEYASVKLIDHVSKQIESGNISCNLYIDLSILCLLIY